MPRETFSLFYNNKTPRPPWAQPATVDYEEFAISFAHSDVHTDSGMRAKKRRLADDAKGNPGSEYTGSLKGNRPTKVSGTVTVCSTANRGTPPDAEGRDLEDTRDQRGHLLALSSGGPEIQLQIIPQPDVINMYAGTHGAYVAANELGWRNLEVYAQYLCQQGRQPGMAPPDYNPSVQVDDYSGSIYVNEEKLVFPPAADYADRTRLQTAPRGYRVDWEVFVIYSTKTDTMGVPVDNYPTEFIVRITCVAPNGAWLRVCENRLRNARSLTEEYAKHDAVRAKTLLKLRQREEADQIKLGRVAFNQAHPRDGKMTGKYPR